MPGVKSLSECWPEYASMALPTMAETIGALMDSSRSWEYQAIDLHHKFETDVERAIACLSRGFAVHQPATTFEQTYAEATFNPMIRDHMESELRGGIARSPFCYFYLCVGLHLGSLSRK